MFKSKDLLSLPQLFSIFWFLLFQSFLVLSATFLPGRKKGEMHALSNVRMSTSQQINQKLIILETVRRQIFRAVCLKKFIQYLWFFSRGAHLTFEENNFVSNKFVYIPMEIRQKIREKQMAVNNI